MCLLNEYCDIKLYHVRNQCPCDQSGEIILINGSNFHDPVMFRAVRLVNVILHFKGFESNLTVGNLLKVIPFHCRLVLLVSTFRIYLIIKASSYFILLTQGGLGILINGP